MVTFFEFDVVPAIMLKHDALVIQVVVTNREVRRVYMDNRAAVSILYWECFETLDIDKNQLRPCDQLQTFAQSEF